MVASIGFDASALEDSYRLHAENYDDGESVTEPIQSGLPLEERVDEWSNAAEPGARGEKHAREQDDDDERNEEVAIGREKIAEECERGSRSAQHAQGKIGHPCRLSTSTSSSSSASTAR